MTAVALLLISVLVAFVVVRIGAAALELTGVPWEEAKFQALSAFTNSGFTTRESELIVAHPVRRRIAAVLIVLGYAVGVASLGSFASAMVNPRGGGLLAVLATAIGGIALIAWVMQLPFFSQRLRSAGKAWFARRFQLPPQSPGDLLHLGDGYQIERFTLAPGSPAARRTLAELALKDYCVQILAIERGGRFWAVPRGTDRLLPGDLLIVYGWAEGIKRLFAPDAADALLLSDVMPLTGGETPAQS